MASVGDDVLVVAADACGLVGDDVKVIADAADVEQPDHRGGGLPDNEPAAHSLCGLMCVDESTQPARIDEVNGRHVDHGVDPFDSGQRLGQTRRRMGVEFASDHEYAIDVRDSELLVGFGHDRTVSPVVAWS